MLSATSSSSPTISSTPSSPSSGNSIRFGSFEFTPHDNSYRQTFSNLQGGLGVTFGSVHYNINAEGILRLPKPIISNLARTPSSSVIGSTVTNPLSVDLLTELSASTNSSPSMTPRSVSSMSVGFDDSMSSDMTSYYCLNCDTKHGLGSDDTLFVCSANYSSGEESIDSVVMMATWRVAHHQIYAILNSAHGGEEGERTSHASRRHNPENSASNDDSDYTIAEEEWAAARAAILSNVGLPSRTSIGTLNAYRSILERNRRRIVADQSSERLRASQAGASRSNQDVPKKKLSYGGLWGSNPQDFIKQAQSRKAFHLVVIKIVFIELKRNAQEETKNSIGQDKILKGASSNSSSLSHGPHICLMAKGSTVPPTMEPNISRGDKDEDEYEEEDWVVSLRDKGKSVFKVLYKDKIASSHFFEILTTAIESQKLIWMHENTIDKKGALEREYADDVASLKDELEEEQTTKEALEETFALELSREKENHDRALEVANELKLKNDKLVFVNAKLLEDFEQLKKGSRAIESALTKLTESHEQLKASYLKEHDNLPSPISINNDACDTNSTSCEASILKENVELRAQLKLLTSNYGKLEENHGKLSSSYEDLLASHDRLKLAHEAIISKETPCSTSSSTCVVANHVEEIKELKAQVSSLKNDLVKGHEGKCKLDKMLSVQQSPNDKSGLGFNSNNKNKSKNNKTKKGQLQVKDPAKIVCFKCKIEGHHVRSCPLKKKQKGKRPQAQTHIQPQVEEMPLPKKNQANAPIVEKSSEKKEKKRTCYICREKGHISSFCTIGTSSNSITIDDVYSLRCNKKKLMKDIKCQVCLEDEDEVSPQVTSRHLHDEEMKCKFKMSQLEENEVQVQDVPKKKLSYGGLWGSNPQDFIKQAQSRKAFHLVVIKIVFIELKRNAQG
ncbi:hypothetical protein QYE76_068214 [Lolium multiflorum]|uniref:CCHC-type domain-containing protein n=1 Tax=Lolium multiflorum TaxID=4521 RepID=A0AAD8SEU8_LOLMU|nr:hypothetical protein QYE76_068214 [Lolium multiflorum]